MSGMWMGKETPHGIFVNGSKINLKPPSGNRLLTVWLKKILRESDSSLTSFPEDLKQKSKTFPKTNKGKINNRQLKNIPYQQFVPH